MIFSQFWEKLLHKKPSSIDLQAYNQTLKMSLCMCGQKLQKMTMTKMKHSQCAAQKRYQQRYWFPLRSWRDLKFGIFQAWRDFDQVSEWRKNRNQHFFSMSGIIFESSSHLHDTELHIFQSCTVKLIAHQALCSVLWLHPLPTALPLDPTMDFIITNLSFLLVVTQPRA